jgi:hypothetical protein
VELIDEKQKVENLVQQSEEVGTGNRKMPRKRHKKQ